MASVIASHPVASRTLSEVPDGTTPTVNTARQTEPTYTAWFVLASVGEMDLSAFYGSYRADGWGRAAFERGPELPYMPVLQGWTRGDYEQCVTLYEAAGVNLSQEPRVGVGSICRRQGTPEVAEIVLGAC